jgi:hypothetical protein
VTRIALLRAATTIALICLGLTGHALIGEPQTRRDIAAAILRENQDEIVRGASEFSQSPRVLASVVFAERSLNIRPAKTMTEVLLARCGYNASLGVAQVKVRTARWIETHLHELSSVRAPSSTVRRRLSRSRLREELIQRLDQPSTNLLYAAAYLALISQVWGEVLDAPDLRSVRVGIVATLYSVGLERPDGSLRVPHADPAMNAFGETAQAFYDGTMLRDEFPK